LAATLLATLAGPVLPAALLLLAGFLLPAAALLAAALLRVALILLIALRILLPWIVRHGTFSGRLRGCELSPRPARQSAASAIVPPAGAQICANCL
jgi:hypothetical protein